MIATRISTDQRMQVRGLVKKLTTKDIITIPIIAGKTQISNQRIVGEILQELYQEGVLNKKGPQQGNTYSINTSPIHKPFLYRRQRANAS